MLVDQVTMEINDMYLLGPARIRIGLRPLDHETPIYGDMMFSDGKVQLYHIKIPGDI